MMQEGGILEFYGNWLRAYDMYNAFVDRTNNHYLSDPTLEDEDIENKLMPYHHTPKWMYPLGYCFKCFGTWVCIICLFIPFSILWHILLIAICYAIMRKLL